MTNLRNCIAARAMLTAVSVDCPAKSSCKVGLGLSGWHAYGPDHELQQI